MIVIEGRSYLIHRIYYSTRVELFNMYWRSTFQRGSANSREYTIGIL